MNKSLQFSDVPHNWAICYQHDCPLADTCLRHHAAMLAPANLMYHVSVLPGARTAEGCTLFVADKPVVLARGMKRMFPTAEPWKDPVLRKGLEGIFGCHAQYYRYRSGRFLITPEQQARVAALFRKHGINSTPRYDQTEELYYFPMPTEMYHQ